MTRAEVLVIGAGPAGIAAATAAATNGCKVVVLDDNVAAGGQIWRDATVTRNGASDSDSDRVDSAKRRALDGLRKSGAQVLGGRSVFAAESSGKVRTLEECGSESLVEEFHFEQLILATGARERFLPFPGWTLAGVFGAGGLQALVRGGYSVAGKRVVVAGTGPLLLAVAAHLAEDAAVVSCVLEQATAGQLARFAASLWSHPSKLVQGARYRGKLWKTPYRAGCWVVEAVAGSDGQKLASVRVTDGSRTWSEACDLLACGYHLVPNTEIAALLGCKFNDNFVRVDAAQRTSLPNVFCVGEPTGIAGFEAATVQGEIAGLTCARRSTKSLERQAAAGHAFADAMKTAFSLRDELRSLPAAETIVCRCEDVSFGKLRDCTDWTDAKLQTRCGMGPCQGRVCGSAVEHLLGWRPVSVRPPLFPVPLQAFCSQHETLESMEPIEERV